MANLFQRKYKVETIAPEVIETVRLR